MEPVAAQPLPSLSDRFSLIITSLCQTIAARGGRDHSLGPLVILLWTRLRRMAARFDALAARLDAGRLEAATTRPTPPRPTPPRPTPPRPATSRPATSGPATSGKAPSGKADRLPRGFAWLVRLMRETSSYASQLQQLLTDPEMAALIAAAPGAGRILRPLCHMLAIRPGSQLHRPPRSPRPIEAGPNPPRPLPDRRRSQGGGDIRDTAFAPKPGITPGRFGTHPKPA